MLLNPLQHMRLSSLLRKKAPKLPQHKQARALKLSGLHRALARYQAKKLGNPNAGGLGKRPWDQASGALRSEQEQPNLQPVSAPSGHSESPSSSPAQPESSASCLPPSASPERSARSERPYSMTQDPPKRLVLVDPQSPFATLAILERHSNEMRQLPDDIQNRQEAIEETEFLLAQRKRMGPLPGDSD